MCLSCSMPPSGLDRDGREQSGDAVYASSPHDDWKGETGFDAVCGSGWEDRSGMIDIRLPSCDHRITMRTTLDMVDDGLHAARVLAAAQEGAVGVALSELAWRGTVARMPVGVRDGFPMFPVAAGTPLFEPDEVAVAGSREDQESAREFWAPGP